MNNRMDKTVKIKSLVGYPIWIYFLIGIHSMQGWTATMRDGVTNKRSIPILVANFWKLTIGPGTSTRCNRE